MASLVSYTASWDSLDEPGTSFAAVEAGAHKLEKDPAGQPGQEQMPKSRQNCHRRGHRRTNRGNRSCNTLAFPDSLNSKVKLVALEVYEEPIAVYRRSREVERPMLGWSQTDLFVVAVE